MVPTQETEPKENRQKRAFDKMTKAQKIRRAVLSGPVKSELRNAREAIWAAKALDQHLRDNDLPPEDISVQLAYMTPDLTILSTLRFKPGKEEEIYAELTGPGKCAVMVGLIFGIRERDPEVLKKFENQDVWVLGAKRFLDTELVRAALEQRIAEGNSLQV